MSIGTFFKSLGHLFNASNLSAAEKVVSDLMPVVGDDLAAYSKSLPGEFDSLLTLAQQAIKLVQDAKSVTLSKSLAIHLAQAVLTAHWPQVAAEAEALAAVL